MRTVAGQIQNYLFPNLNSLTSAESTFVAFMAAQIGNGATVEAQNFGAPTPHGVGNEHFGFTFSGAAPLPDLAVDIPVPAGSVMAVHYAVDAIASYLNALWSILTVQNRRCRLKKLDGIFVAYGIEPDSAGPVELGTLTLAAAGTGITTIITGTYLVGHDLPNVPFSIAFQESITVQATVPTSTSLTTNTLPAVLSADTGHLIAALDALIAIGASLTGIFGASLGGFGVNEIHDYLLGQLRPISGALGLLATVVHNMPGRIPLPGTTDNLIFHYSSVTFPQGTLATSGHTTAVNPVTPGAAIVFLGGTPPVRTRMLGLVLITGPATVTVPLPSGAHPGPNPGPIPIAAQFSALVSDQAVQPTFQWTLESPTPAAAATVQLSGSSAQQVSVLFNAGGHPSPFGVYTLCVVQDDSLHLKDSNGHTPSAAHTITLAQATIPTPKPGNGGPLRPLQP